MDILVGMLTYKKATITQRAIASIGDSVDLLVIDNGADRDVKAILPQTGVIHNPENVGVNPGWNQLVEHFLAGDWKWLVIASSDVTMANNWADVLRSRMDTPNAVFMPRLVDNIHDINRKAPETVTVALEATPGFFYCMPREAVEIAFPIPEGIKIWFGDEWVFTKLRRLGWQTQIVNNMLAHHVWSSNITSQCIKLIEEDKVAWESIKLLLPQ